MAIPRSRKLFFNFAATVGGKFTYFIQVFAAVPLFLSFWPVEQYGHWLVLTAVPSWLAMTDLGFGTAAANQVTYLSGAGDRDAARRCLHSACVAMGIILVTASFLLGAASYALPWGEWLGEAGSRGDARWVILLSGATVIAGFPAELVRGIFRAVDLSEIASAWSSAKPIVDLSVIAVALFFGAGPVSVAGALLGAQIAYVLSFALTARSRSRALRLGFREARRDEIMHMLRRGLAYCLFPLANTLVIQGPIIAINAYLGTAAVVLFSTVRTFTRIGYQATTMVYTVVLPEMGRNLGAGRLADSRTLHRLAVIVTLAATTIFAMGTVAFGRQLISWWVPGQLAVSRELLLVFALGVVGNGLWVASSVVQTACNRHEALAFANLAAATLGVTLCTLAAREGHLVAAALVIAMSEYSLVPFVLRRSFALTGDSARRVASEFPETLQCGRVQLLRLGRGFVSQAVGEKS